MDRAPLYTRPGVQPSKASPARTVSVVNSREVSYDSGTTSARVVLRQER